MKKWLAVAFVVALSLTLGSMAANAQTQVTLGPSASGSISFVSSGGTVNINLGSCSGGTCTLQGLSALFPAGPDSYTLTATGPITLNSNGSVSQANPILFSYNNGAGGTLTGTLQLVNFTQVGSLGVVNDTLMANLTNLGGTLASSFGGSAVEDVTIVVQGGGSIAALFSSNGTIYAYISTGEIVPTPETSTMVLFGTGLLALSFFLRKRMVSAPLIREGAPAAL